MLKWKIYYLDGSTFDSSQGLPHEAPKTGVLCIGQECPEHGRVIRAGKDFYIWNEVEGWWQCDACGFWQYMFEPGLKTVAFGTNATKKVYDAVLSRALADLYLPPKTARHPLE